MACHFQQQSQTDAPGKAAKSPPTTNILSGLEAVLPLSLSVICAHFVPKPLNIGDVETLLTF
jgi:hypothetical protein